ncbi:hypothetical protein M3J09_006724 [Ascochyta lentis]
MSPVDDTSQPQALKCALYMYTAPESLALLQCCIADVGRRCSGRKMKP